MQPAMVFLRVIGDRAAGSALAKAGQAACFEGFLAQGFVLSRSFAL